MADKPVTPIIVGVLSGALITAGGVFYAMLFGTLPGGGIWRVIIAVGVAALIAALTAVVLIRIRELKGEDENDYRKY